MIRTCHIKLGERGMYSYDVIALDEVVLNIYF